MAAEILFERIDKHGFRFQVGESGYESFAPLTEMYDGFSRTDLSQGLPPPDERIRRRWVETLLKSANNFLAWRDGRVIGHSCLMADLNRRDAEFVIFVSELSRNRGIGTELTALALEKARKLGLQKMWLTVEAYNFRAIRLYQKFGFEFSGHADKERIMVLNL